MTWAKFHPKKTLMADSIPRPGTDRQDPAFTRMEALCRDSTYTGQHPHHSKLNQSSPYTSISEFFWFPNNGTESGYWENCWTDDGLEEDSVDINEEVADDYQVSLWLLYSLSLHLTTGGFYLHV